MEQPGTLGAGCKTQPEFIVVAVGFCCLNLYIRLVWFQAEFWLPYQVNLVNHNSIYKNSENIHKAEKHKKHLLRKIVKARNSKRFAFNDPKTVLSSQTHKHTVQAVTSIIMNETFFFFIFTYFVILLLNKIWAGFRRKRFSRDYYRIFPWAAILNDAIQRSSRY